jgi:outer membrane protein OmpA-like peptidoglycan-associated protein
MIGKTRIVTGSTVIQTLLLFVGFCLTNTVIRAQGPNPTTRSIKAVGYPVGGGSTMVDLVSTGMIPQAHGEAKVEARPAVTTVEVEIQGLTLPTQLGSEFLTYVLWVVSPEGRAINLGEVLYEDDGKGKLKATTQLQSFSLFVTAEPYFAVQQPSEMLIMENATRKNTKGKLFVVNNYQLMSRAQYQKLGNPLALSMDLKNVPLELYEARNAVEIAKSRGAEKYAPDILSKAEGGLKMAENALARKANKKDIVSLARQASQSSEDARAVSAEKQEQERVAAERAAAAAAAKALAEEKAAAEAAVAKRQADEAARLQAEIAAGKEALLKAEAAANEARIKSEAAEAKRQADEAARRQAEIAAAKEAQAKAEADALRAKEEAAKAEAERARRATEELRAQLLEQFNRILETRDTPRGLVITMADVLFDTGKYDLRPAARERLARLSGIVLAHPGLRLEVEGHTDSTGSDELNQKLSEQRASTVREYLISQALAADNIAAKGFGKSMPIATNDTPAGRQKNRRVEMIVSGDVIGVKVGQ